MGKKKMSFDDMVALRKENHDEFIRTVFETCQNHVFFDGELMLKSYEKIEKDGKEITIATDKWIMFTEEEKNTLINMAKNKWEKEKAELLKECDERYARTENHPYKELYDNAFTSNIICAALDDGQEIPGWLFIKACRLFDKHKENEDSLWKSYRFKGFVRWNQIEKAMKYNEHSNSKAKNE
jgi:hypothetical protein